MREITLHLLDIVENSVAAQAKSIQITIMEDLASDHLTVSVKDDGKGLDSEMLKLVVDPFVTSRTTRKVGLGIPLFKAAAEACNGSLEINSSPGLGTCLTADFQRSHIDRMPLGDIAGTFLTLLAAHPEISWHFLYRARLPEALAFDAYDFDDQAVKEILGDISLTEPEVLSYLRGELEEGISEIQNKLQEVDARNSTSFSPWILAPGF